MITRNTIIVIIIIIIIIITITLINFTLHEKLKSVVKTLNHKSHYLLE